MAKAERTICPAPLPEDPADARLTGLLAPAPHVVPEKKAKKKATGTRKSSRFQVLSDEEESLSPGGGREEKEGLPNKGGRRVQEGKNSSPGLFRQRQ